jgi:hypothetical protein
MLKVNADFPLKDTGISNALGVDALPRHRWYFVKEGFSPMLVQKAIETESIKKGELLVDPFSGSGTAVLAGALAGLDTQAFEINPFLCFLSATKLLNARPRSLIRQSEVILKALRGSAISHLEGYSTFTRGNRWNRWLFPTSVLRSFESGRSELMRMSPNSRPLLKLALIGAAMDCCNASRDGKCLRYPNGWEDDEATPATLREQFQSRVGAIAADLESSRLDSSKATVIEGDARLLVKRMSSQFKLCVTSPPYLNSFDYSDVYRPELFLGGFVESNERLMRIRLNTIRSHVQANWKSPTKKRFGTLYKHCISGLHERIDELWDPRLLTMVQAYFEDMDVVLRGLRKKALPDASIWLVVSTSAYASVEIPVDLILAEIGQEAGWYLREVGALRYLRSSSQHVEHVSEAARKSVPLRESVVIFDATPRCSNKKRGVNKPRCAPFAT